MIERKIKNELKLLIKQYKVVTITGPRQAGKTTLAKMEFPNFNYVNMEDPEARLLATTDAREFLKRFVPPVIIDEIQRVPELLSYIQVECDKSDKKGLYILTGSHQPELKAKISQSLAGRTAILQLLPLSIEELTDAGITLDRDEYIFKGFMPQLYEENIDINRYYRNYFMTYVERDASQLINIKNFATFERFIKLLAGRVGQLINYSSLANDVGVSTATITEWISILEASYIIFRLPPYFENFGKRLTKSAKLYFTEIGLVAYLLELKSSDMVARDPLLGGLFENMVILEALKKRYNSGENSNLYFFRDSNGMEIDLLQATSRQLYPIEIKAARTFNKEFLKNINKFRKLSNNVQAGTIIYSGEATQTINDDKLINFVNTTSCIN